MYNIMFITYICIFSDKLPSHIQTFGLLLILSRFIGLPRYSYQPFVNRVESGWQYSDGKFCRIILVYFVEVGPKEKANSVVFVRKRHLCSVSSYDGHILLHSFVFC